MPADRSLAGLWFVKASGFAKLEVFSKPAIVSVIRRFWLGVELDHAHGKNDGSRSGVRYFRCKPNHGIFVLPSKVKRSVKLKLMINKYM